MQCLAVQSHVCVDVGVCYSSNASLPCTGVTISESALVLLCGRSWHWVLAFSCFDHECRGALYRVMLVAALPAQSRFSNPTELISIPNFLWPIARPLRFLIPPPLDDPRTAALPSPAHPFSYGDGVDGWRGGSATSGSPGWMLFQPCGSRDDPTPVSPE